MSHLQPPGPVRTSSGPVVSPELALVDAGLAEYARTWLPGPGDTLGRIEKLLQARRLSASRMAHPHVATPAQLGDNRPLRGPRAPGRVRSSLFALAIVGGILGTAVLVGVRVDVRGNRAGADSVTVGTPPAPPAPVIAPPEPQASGARASRPKKTGAAPVHRQQHRRFAWAPTQGASGYHIELFRGDVRVFAEDTKEPQIAIPARWTLNGRRHELSAGEYRWLVWPVVSGLRASRATVQATLTMSG